MFQTENNPEFIDSMNILFVPTHLNNYVTGFFNTNELSTCGSWLIEQINLPRKFTFYFKLICILITMLPSSVK